MYNDRLMTCKWECAECNKNAKPETPTIDCAPGGLITEMSQTLPITNLSNRIEEYIAAELKSVGIDQQKTPPVTVRVVSTLECYAAVPEQVSKREWSFDEDPYPTEMPYTSRAIMAFQEQDGAEVAIFCLYVQEYGNACPQPNQNRVYISYLDSVRYFKCYMKDGSVTPRHNHRTTVYHSFLLAYLGYVRDQGFTHVHIWVEPPKQHDEYIFFARPLNDRCTNQSNTMKREKLRQWYVHMLDKGQERKIVESVGSLCDAFADIKSAREIPLFKGDQWEFTLAELIDGKRKGESKRAVLTRKVSSLMLHTRSSN